MTTLRQRLHIDPIDSSKADKAVEDFHKSVEAVEEAARKGNKLVIQKPYSGADRRKSRGRANGPVESPA